MKLALTREEESQCTFQGGNEGSGRCRRAGEDLAAGVTVKLARVVRLAGVNPVGHCWDCDTTTIGAVIKEIGDFD